VSRLAPTLEAFFTDRLARQRQASAHTVAAYRDTFRLLLSFAHERTGTAPNNLDLADLDAALISAFLEHLEQGRHNSVRTRNARLAAIHSLFNYAAMRHPEHAALIARVLAMPAKRHERALVTFLTRAEIDALLAAPDLGCWQGRRDRALLLLAVQTGLRVSEVVVLTVGDVVLSSGAHVRCHGKGRKERVTPLTPTTVSVLRAWLVERQGVPEQPLFPTSKGGPLSRDAVEKLLTKHVRAAATTCPSLRTKTVSPHTLRHTAAMQLLEAGVDATVIALWLGHEQVATTSIYLHADLTIKERAIARTTPPEVMPGRFRPSDALLAFLEAL
jgi:site-specific recombinase XerD